MGNINESLSKTLNRLGIARQVEAAGVVERAQKEIAKFIPEEDFEVVSFNRGILKVSVNSSSAASEINLKRELIKSVSKEITNFKIVISNCS